MAELGEEAEEAKALGRLLFDSALLESGWTPDDPKAFTQRVQVGCVVCFLAGWFGVTVG